MKNDLIIQIKSQTMQHPFDLIGSRRAFLVISKLHEVLHSQPKEAFHHLDISNKHMVEESGLLYWNTKQLILVISTFVYVLVKFLGFYTFDSVTDVLVLINNYQLSNEVSSLLELSANETINEIAIFIPRRSLTNSLPWIGLGIFLVISGYLTTIKIPCLVSCASLMCYERSTN